MQSQGQGLSLEPATLWTQAKHFTSELLVLKKSDNTTISYLPCHGFSPAFSTTPLLTAPELNLTKTTEFQMG